MVRAPLLSIGTPGPLNQDRLRALAEVSDESNCPWIIHPLGVSETDETRLEAPVPVSLTAASLDQIAANVRDATRVCGRPGLIEPITSLLRVPGTIAETDFLNRVCEQAGCRLLIDVTTLLVASRIHDFDARAWLAAIDDGLVAAARIGGCARRAGGWRRDAGGGADEEAWELLRAAMDRVHPEVLILEAPRHAVAEDLHRDVQRLRTLGALSTAVGRQARRGPPGAVQPATPAPRPDLGPPSVTSAIDRIEVAPDAAFFVLDDQGVFLSESRQELVLFNTAAALLWCLIEDGVPVPGLITAYQQAAGVALDQASRDVGTALQRWFGLGYTRTPVPSMAPGLRLATALALVLTNPGLRQRFRQTPWGVAGDLGVVESDTASFVGLNPDELDAQAEEFEHLRSARHRTPSYRPREREAVPAPDVTAGTRPGARAGGSRADRRYRLVATTVSITCGTDALADRVHEVLGHLESPASEPDVVLDIRQDPAGRWIVLDDGRPYRRCHDIQDVVPLVIGILRHAAATDGRALLEVHAAVLSFGDGCILLPAAAGSGKTMLTAGLIRTGATYYSDEIAILDAVTRRVAAVPLPLSIKDGGLIPLRPFYSGLDTLTTHRREDHQRVRYLPPPPGSLAPDRHESVRWLVFPAFDPLADTALRPVTRPDGLRRLLGESLVLPRHFDRTLAASLVQMMRDVACYELTVSSLETAVGLLRGLMLGPAPRPEVGGP